MSSSNAEVITNDTKTRGKTNTEIKQVTLKNQNILKTVKTDGSLTKNGEAIRANTDILGKQNMRVEGSLMESGEQRLAIPFAKDNFTLDQLFNDFETQNLDWFIFNDVNIQIEANPSAQQPTEIHFSGRLDISHQPLKQIASLLNMQEAPLLTAVLTSGDTDLADKLKPQNVTFKSEATLEVEIIPGVYLSSASFHIAISKDATGSWEIAPEVNGVMELTELGDGNAVIKTHLHYENAILYIRGVSEKIHNAFDIPGLTLSNLVVESELGKSKDISLKSDFYAKGNNYKLAGAITEESGGVFFSASQFDSNNLKGIFAAITGSSMEMPEFPFELQDVVLGFASADGDYAGQSLEAGATIKAKAKVDELTTGVKAQIQSTGIELMGDIQTLSVGPVNIDNASMAINCYAKATGRDSYVAILGESTIEGVDVECKLVFEQQNGKWEQVLYAGLNAKAFRMSTVFPSAKDSFLDTFSFTRLAFIYSSFEGKVADPDFDFNVKKGLQLLGNMNQIPALSDLTGNNKLNLELQAYFGTQKSVAIALPDTRLNLGSSVTTSPFTLGLEFTPSPALDLVFGMDVNVPKQQDPLHFDLSLNVGAIQASGAGTMKNYWENPFGLQGLKVGPNLALEVGIIYQQFLATGTPSSFGFVGGLVLGDVAAQMAMKISAIPSEQILMGSLEKLSPQNLIAFVNDVSGTVIPANALPDIIDIQDLELYIAPSGGCIGTVTFEQGFSFDADIVIFDKPVSVHARLGDDGISAEGSVDRIALGPLTIQGKEGNDAQFDFDLTTSRQAILIDGEIDFLGTGVGIFADISSSGIEFQFDQHFLGLLTYSVEGRSSGSFHKPKTLDFVLSAEFDNEITAYIKNNIANKLDSAGKGVSESIEQAQAKVEKAEREYKKEFEAAQQNLNQAKAKADALANQLNSELTKAKRHYKQDIKAAKAELTKAKKVYDNALKDAQKAVHQAEATYNNAMSRAQASVDKAQRTYNNGIKTAQAALTKAERDYKNAVKSAQRTLDSALRKVNSLNSSLSRAKKNLKKAKKWPPNPAKVLRYGAEITGLETAKGTASLALKAAKTAVSGITKGAQYAAFTSAKAALSAAKDGANYLAFKSAKATLEATKKGAQYTAFAAAKKTLIAVQRGAEYTAWEAAEQGLKAAQIAGQSAINTAQDSIDNIGKTSVYLAFKVAKEGLEAVKQGSAFVAFESAKASLEGAKQSAGATLKLGEYMAKHSGDIVDIRHVKLSGHLKGILKGEFFKAQIELSLFSKPYKTSIDFDVQDAESFMEALFKEALLFFKRRF